jgi:hypothetical protein
MSQESVVLPYAERRQRRPFWTRRTAAGLSKAFALLLLCYAGAWLSIANGGVDYDGGNWGTAYYRSPGHLYRGLVASAIFEPAYRVDRWLRPKYWSWAEPPAGRER